MTVATEISRSGPYAGAGSPGPFTVGFRFLDQAHLEVIKTIAGVDTTLTLGADYSVAGVGNPTGSVTLTAPLAVGQQLTIIRNVPRTQEADYVQNDNFPAESHENALDKLTMITQELAEVIDRALIIPPSITGVSTDLPSPEANMLIGWNAVPDALVNISPDEIASIVAFATAVVDVFSGTGAQTVFTLSENPGALGNLDIAIGGVTQRHNIDFTWVGGTTLTFTTPPPLGTDNILVRYMQGLPAGITALDQIEGVIAADMTLNVPSVYPTIQDAFTYLADKLIATGVTVTIQVANGTYVMTSGITLNHPQGDQIRLLGNIVTPASCVLRVVGMSSFDMLIAYGGHTFGYVDGFRIESTLKADLAHNSTGILALQNATIICGPNIEVNNFYYGIAARDGSYVVCDGAVVTNAGDVGIWAFTGSTVSASGATSNGASDVPNNLGFGFQAEFGSTLIATGASASTCRRAGFAALSNSTCRIHNCNSNGNTGSGFASYAGGHVEAIGCTAGLNTRYGVEIEDYGMVFGVVDGGGNALGFHNTYAQLGATAGQARVFSVTGDMRVDSATGAIFFNAGSGLQHAIRDPGAAVTSSTLTKGGTAALTPVYTVDGAAANIGVRLDAKGTGAVFLASNNTNYTSVTPGGAGVGPIIAAEGETNVDMSLRGKGSGSMFLGSHRVNYIRINPGAAGNSPLIAPEGEANLDLVLSAKGTGFVRYGTFTGAADAVSTGYIEIRDFAGNVRRLMVRA